MTMNPFAADLAAEHRRDLLEHAADSRLARSARVRRHPRASGRTVRIRPVRPRDAPLLADIFARLSPASRLARFLFPKHELTAAELRCLADIDHHDHEAVIAVTPLGREPVGVARFVRDPDDPASAEVAVEVVDDWQGLGVGSMLVTSLAARARSEGVTQFTALMSVDNRRSQRLVRKLGGITDVERDGATVSYHVALPAPAPAPTPGWGTPSTFAGRA